MLSSNNREKHFTASALIIDDNKVLLLYHKKLGIWLYPGGHVENNENPEETVVREVMEETGLHIEILGEKDGNLANPETDISVLYNPYAFLCELVGDHYHNDIVYLCKIHGENKEIKYNEGESQQIRFFSLDEIKNIELFPNFRRLLEKALKEN